jgi:hypothetical protein
VDHRTQIMALAEQGREGVAWKVANAGWCDARTLSPQRAGQRGASRGTLACLAASKMKRAKNCSAPRRSSAGSRRCRFTLVDPKRVTFNGASFRGAVAAHLDGPVRFDI